MAYAGIAEFSLYAAGPSILWLEKAKKSHPISFTSTFMWGTDCAPSTRTTAPFSCAMLVIFFASFMLPKTLDTWVKET